MKRASLHSYPYGIAFLKMKIQTEKKGRGATKKLKKLPYTAVIYITGP